MRIKLQKNVRGSLRSVANYAQPGKMYLIVMGSISEMGLELDVNTNYLFKTEFNASIPQHTHEKLCRYIIDHHLPKHRCELIGEDEIRKYLKEHSLFSVQLGLVGTIINDQRPLSMRCIMTGRVIPKSNIPKGADTSSLEVIDYAPKNRRVWRLENMSSGERLELNDTELKEKFNKTPLELLQSIDYTGKNTEWRLNDSHQEMERA